MFASRLAKLDADLGSCLEELDVDRLSGADAARLVKLLSSIESRVCAAKLLCGRRAVDTNAHVLSGARDGASWFASLAGTSVGAAKESLTTASRLESLPDVKKAFLSGDLSVDQTREVARAAVDDPSSVSALLDVADKSSMVGLKRACREVAARSRESEHYEQLRSKRFFRTWSDGDGMLNGAFRLMPDDGAGLLAKLKPFVSDAFRAARLARRRESRDAYLADGLCALVDTAGSGVRKSRAEIVVVADYEALKRGYAKDGESCEIEGVGPVPVALVESLRDDCYLSQIVLREGKPAMVRGKGHYIPNRLRLAVKVRDKCCSVPGCDSTFRLEVDHVVPKARGGPTELSNLALLCKAHHDQKTYRGFRLVGSGRDRKWVRSAEPDTKSPVNEGLFLNTG